MFSNLAGLGDKAVFAQKFQGSRPESCTASTSPRHNCDAFAFSVVRGKLQIAEVKTVTLSAQVVGDALISALRYLIAVYLYRARAALNDHREFRFLRVHGAKLHEYGPKSGRKCEQILEKTRINL